MVRSTYTTGAKRTCIGMAIENSGFLPEYSSSLPCNNALNPDKSSSLRLAQHDLAFIKGIAGYLRLIDDENLVRLRIRPYENIHMVAIGAPVAH